MVVICNFMPISAARSASLSSLCRMNRWVKYRASAANSSCASLVPLA
jgi:hypothetical protein